MRLVQLVLTGKQAEIVSAALTDTHYALTEAQRDLGGVEITSEDVVVNEQMAADIAAVGRLQLLFQDAFENPLKYKPSPKLATIRSIVKARKVPVPQSRRKRRADRHQRRKAERMLFRRNQEYIANVNRAQEQYAKDEAEYQTSLDEIQKRIEGQPTFTIQNGFGDTIMAGVPAEFVVDEQDVSLQERHFTKPTLVLPPNVEE